MNITLDSCWEDLERYERELRRARMQHLDDHPVVQRWLGRRRACLAVIKVLEERAQ